MPDSRPRIMLASNARERKKFVDEAEVERLERFADWACFECGVSGHVEDEPDKDIVACLRDRLPGVDGLIVCSSCPVIDADMMDSASGLRIIGELGGDRFAARIDVEAAWARGIRTVDTSNGASNPTAEWALALMLISLRNAGRHFRRILTGTSLPSSGSADPEHPIGELTGKRVGLVGCGYIGRRLIKLLQPFETDVWVYDPYLPTEIADAVGFRLTSLDNVLTQCDIIVCLVPLTPATEGMIGRRELDLIPDGRALVNVSRGKVIDSAALVSRLKRGGLVAGLDVFDPEPFGDHEIIHLDNVFLSPHIAGVVDSGYKRMFSLMVEELDRFFHGHNTLFDLTPQTMASRRGIAPDH